jgi:hypothetical protein
LFASELNKGKSGDAQQSFPSAFDEPPESELLEKWRNLDSSIRNIWRFKAASLMEASMIGASQKLKLSTLAKLTTRPAQQAYVFSAE